MESLLSWPTDDLGALTRTDIVRWWESCRLRFNLYVGAVGLVTWFLVLIAGSAAVKPGVDFEEPIAMIFGPFAYAFMANLCYTLVWLVDTVQFRGSPRTKLYKVGVVFSVILTALPGVWAVVAWVMTLITGHKLD
jgi:hypothetical protein